MLQASVLIGYIKAEKHIAQGQTWNPAQHFLSCEKKLDQHICNESSVLLPVFSIKRESASFQVHLQAFNLDPGDYYSCEKIFSDLQRRQVGNNQHCWSTTLRRDQKRPRLQVSLSLASCYNHHFVRLFPPLGRCQKVHFFSSDLAVDDIYIKSKLLVGFLK